ncbi:MAG: ABC transporter ATP-binding protein [Rhodocyclaceae bacterium]|nr:ABC transporter ATP-binding protein [Rhodocyclaceae bacterium]
MKDIAVSIEKVSKRYGQTIALDSVDLTVRPGEILGLLGPNGAGKTTLISAMAGLVRTDAGAITIMGHDVQRNYRQARRALGVVPQELAFDPFFTVRETLRLQSGYFGAVNNDDWIDHVLVSLDLVAKANSNMRTLSGGMKRRVLVAQALVHRPPVIVLDEPTAGVDVELRQSLWRFIRELNRDGHTIILTTHYLDEAQALCDRIAILRAGRLVALDTTSNLLETCSGYLLRILLEGDIPAPYANLLVVSGGWREIELKSFKELELILSAMREGGTRIVDIEINKLDLEAVFLRIMQKESGI